MANPVKARIAAHRLIARYGFVAAARRIGISTSTLRSVMRGEHEPRKKTQQKIERTR